MTEASQPVTMIYRGKRDGSTGKLGDAFICENQEGGRSELFFATGKRPSLTIGNHYKGASTADFKSFSGLDRLQYTGICEPEGDELTLWRALDTNSKTVVAMAKQDAAGKANTQDLKDMARLRKMYQNMNRFESQLAMELYVVKLLRTRVKD